LSGGGEARELTRTKTRPDRFLKTCQVWDKETCQVFLIVPRGYGMRGLVIKSESETGGGKCYKDGKRRTGESI
jgi:hypothetical protein